MSSEEGYFAFLDTFLDPSDPRYGRSPPLMVWRISRQKINYDAAGPGGEAALETVWSHVFGRSVFDDDPLPRLTLADNGAWVALNTRNISVLDTGTGDTVFTYLEQAQQLTWSYLARQANVLPLDATAGDVGGIEDVEFVGNDLVVTWDLRCRFAPALAEAGSEAEKLAVRQKLDDCRANWRHLRNWKIADIFHMETIERSAPPDMRVALDREVPCGAGNHPLRGLQNRAGRLVFLADRANAR